MRCHGQSTAWCSSQKWWGLPLQGGTVSHRQETWNA